MQEESADTQQLQTGWRSILVIWGALFTSLGAYLAVALVAEKSVNIKLQIDFPLETVQYAVGYRSQHLWPHFLFADIY